ncbi:MAG TPA: hypothetical protein VFJ90_13810 [Candidatus Didemnitutus sp.]|nr:hypothetical protein [Candidatus Didemnitutus sp.]
MNRVAASHFDVPLVPVLPRAPGDGRWSVAGFISPANAALPEEDAFPGDDTFFLFRVHSNDPWTLGSARGLSVSARPFS